MDNLVILRKVEKFFQDNAHKVAVATASELVGSREVVVKLNKKSEVLRLPVFSRRGIQKFPYRKKSLRRISTVISTCTTVEEVILAVLNTQFNQAQIYQELLPALKPVSHIGAYLLILVALSVLCYYCYFI